MSDYAYNRKASFDYEFLDKYEAGLVLSGAEVKSTRAGRLTLPGAFVTINGEEAFLLKDLPGIHGAASVGYDDLSWMVGLDHLQQGAESIDVSRSRGGIGGVEVWLNQNLLVFHEWHADRCRHLLRRRGAVGAQSHCHLSSSHCLTPEPMDFAG